MARDTDEVSQTLTREPNAVGSPGPAPAGGGRQTAEQAAITDMGEGGLSDEERKGSLAEGGEAGRAPPVPGGSSGGHSDQKASRGAGESERIAGGHSKSEQAKSEQET